MEALLKTHNLRITPIRKKILNLLEDTPYAITHSQLEDILGKEFDRVTTYRTLHTFEEKHLIHRILNDTGAWAYALCRTCDHNHEHEDEKAHHHVQHNHVHFKCEQCQNTVCLDNTAIPIINLPSGYKAQEWQMLVLGICPSCQA